MQEARKNEPTPEAATEWVSLNEATRLLDLHRETILKLVIKGTLVADTRGNLTWISRESIDRHLAATAA